MAGNEIRHIQHTHANFKNVAWCGKRLVMEWAYTSLDHAAYTAVQGGNGPPICKKCIKAAVKALRQIHLINNLQTTES